VNHYWKSPAVPAPAGWNPSAMVGAQYADDALIHAEWDPAWSQWNYVSYVRANRTTR